MKPPAFPFYVKDWLAGTRRLTFTQKGAYIDLLAWSWDNGPLPFRVAQLAHILGTTPTQLREVWAVLSRHRFCPARGSGTSIDGSSSSGRSPKHSKHYKPRRPADRGPCAAAAA